MNIKPNCGLCGAELVEDQEVTTLLSVNITEKGCQPGEFRLKLSEDSLNRRFKKVFCQDCLKMEQYIADD